jgi:dienelactone hydrolase
MGPTALVSIFALAFTAAEASTYSASTTNLNCQTPENSSKNKSNIRASKTINFQSFRSLSYVNLSSKEPLPQASLTIQASVFKPAGNGPFSAVIVNHGSAGLGGNHFDYAKEIVAAGKVAVVFDGFCPRNISGTAGNQSSLSLITSVADNYRLLAALQKEPYIDKKKISAIGTSRGGSALILAADEKMRSRFQIGPHPFFSFAAIYPGCSTQLENKQPSSTRLLVQLGKMDTYFSPERCREVIASMKDAQFGVEKLEYNAHHGWDLGGSPKYLPSEMSYGRCNMVVGSDGVPTENTSKIRMDSMSNSKRAFEACGTKGALIAPSEIVKQRSMDDLMRFLDADDPAQKMKKIGVTR